MIKGLKYGFLVDVVATLRQVHQLENCTATFWPQNHEDFVTVTECESNWEPIDDPELGGSNAHLVFGYIHGRPWLYFDHGWGSNVYTVKENIQDGLGVRP